MKWLKFVRLSWKERLLFLRVAFLLLATRFLLLWLPYKAVLRFYKWLARPTEGKPLKSPTKISYMDSVVYLTNASGRRVLGTKPCLPQALVVESLLKRRNIDASLKIGVTKSEGDELLAHAWVEHNGEIIIGGRLSETRYKRLQPLKSGST